LTKFLTKELEKVHHWSPRLSGRVIHVIGLLIESYGPEVSIGEICYIFSKQNGKIPCQVVGFKDQKVLLMSLDEMGNIYPGAEVFPTGEVHRVQVSEALCGRILDGLGRPIDGKGDLPVEKYYPVTAPPPPPLSRRPIQEILPTGIKSIDALSSIGKGQRMGIFSSPGVGKSTLMGMIAREAQADINVIALIGERGREVREFVERELGPEGLARSVVVVATADQAALLRSKGAHVATAIAEYFRDLGKEVILLMDSISRFAMALREIGLAAGEPPTTRGYPPSVFASLPRLLERAGNSDKGSITGFYTVLCEEEEMYDPIPEQVKSLLDGHIYLSRALAEAHFFPPVDVLKSLSRVMSQVTSEKHQREASKVRRWMQAYREAEELIHLGAYAPGSNLQIDEAIQKMAGVRQFLAQDKQETTPLKNVLELLEKL